jgi:hypothetical protein
MAATDASTTAAVTISATIISRTMATNGSSSTMRYAMFSWDAAVAVAWSEIGRIVPNHLTRKSFSRYVGYLTDTALFAGYNEHERLPWRRSSARQPFSSLRSLAPPVGQGTRLWHWNTPARADATVCSRRSRLQIILFFGPPLEGTIARIGIAFARGGRTG